MRVIDIAGRELIVENLRSDLRSQSIAELVARMAGVGGFTRYKTALYQAELLRRQEAAPGGLGHGVAFLRAPVTGLPKPLMTVGMSGRGIDYQAPDGSRAHVVMLYLGHPYPSENERMLVAALESRFVQPEVGERLRRVRSAAEMWEELLLLDSECVAQVKRWKEDRANGVPGSIGCIHPW